MFFVVLCTGDVILVCGRVPWLYQYWPGGFMVLWLEYPEAQPAVVQVLKRLRRQGLCFKSHPTDWEQPGIEPVTPGLQDIGLFPTLRRRHNLHFQMMSPKTIYKYKKTSIQYWRIGK